MHRLRPGFPGLGLPTGRGRCRPGRLRRGGRTGPVPGPGRPPDGHATLGGRRRRHPGRRGNPARVWRRSPAAPRTPAGHPGGNAAASLLQPPRPAAGAGLAAVSLVAAAALLVGLVGLFYSGRLQQQRDEADRLRARAEEQSRLAEGQRAVAEQQSQRAREQEAEASRQRARADRLLYGSQMALAYRPWHDNPVRQAEDLLEPYRPGGAGQADLRGFEWFYLRRLCHGEQLDLPTPDTALFQVLYSPDGTRLATAGIAWEGQKPFREVKVRELPDGRDVFAHRVPGQGTVGVAFSPDGTRLAGIGFGPGVQLWDGRTGKEGRALGGWAKTCARSPSAPTASALPAPGPTAP